MMLPLRRQALRPGSILVHNPGRLESVVPRVRGRGLTSGPWPLLLGPSPPEARLYSPALSARLP